MSATLLRLMCNPLDALQIAKTAQDFQDIALEGARLAGFTGFFYLYGPPGAPEVLSSYSPPWGKSYLRLSRSGQDPIMRRVGYETQPFEWDFGARSIFRTTNARFAREAARYGILCGVTVPIHAGFGRLAALTFSGPPDSGPSNSEKTGVVAALALLGIYFHVYFTARGRLVERPMASVLTGRQRQCLAWSAKGKTMSETGQILGISQRTVLFHLQDARARLNAQTLTHAVAEAIGRAEIPQR